MVDDVAESEEKGRVEEGGCVDGALGFEGGFADGRCGGNMKRKVGVGVWKGRGWVQVGRAEFGRWKRGRLVEETGSNGVEVRESKDGLFEFKTGRLYAFVSY